MSTAGCLIPSQTSTPQMPAASPKSSQPQICPDLAKCSRGWGGGQNCPSGESLPQTQIPIYREFGGWKNMFISEMKSFSSRPWESLWDRQTNLSNKYKGERQEMQVESIYETIRNWTIYWISNGILKTFRHANGTVVIWFGPYFRDANWNIQGYVYGLNGGPLKRYIHVPEWDLIQKKGLFKLRVISLRISRWNPELSRWVLNSKTSVLGTSLAVQWLRPCASTAGGTGSIPGWELRSCMPHGAAKTFKKKKKKKKKTSVLIRDTQRRDTQGSRPHKDRGRDWSNVAMSRGNLGPQELEEAR